MLLFKFVLDFIGKIIYDQQQAQIETKRKAASADMPNTKDKLRGNGKESVTKMGKLIGSTKNTCIAVRLGKFDTT